MAPAAGAGYLLANDRLTDAAYALIQPSVNTVVPVGGIATGSQTVAAWDPSMYVGAQIVVGTPGSVDLEVVTITATVPGTSFTATFANVHTAGEEIVGATFPVRGPTDQLFTQAEMIQYLSKALSDFLTDCPLVYTINNSTVVQYLQQNTALPTDCQFPVRVAAFNYPLKETSQANLDTWDYRWTQATPTEPSTYFRDKLPPQTLGVFPRAGNDTTLEIVYASSGPGLLGLADGFPIPDPFTIPVLSRTLAFAFSKDGEMRNPGLAKFFQQRYDLGIKVCSMFLEAIMDSNLELPA